MAHEIEKYSSRDLLKSAEARAILVGNDGKSLKSTVDYSLDFQLTENIEILNGILQCHKVKCFSAACLLLRTSKIFFSRIKTIDNTKRFVTLTKWYMGPCQSSGMCRSL